jgi:hypothetical protein
LNPIWCRRDVDHRTYRPNAATLSSRPARFSLRGRHELSPSPSLSTSSSATVSSHNPHKRIRTTVPGKRPTVVVQNAQPKSKPTKRTSDPLDRLLKEKKHADKKGNGVDALKMAENALAERAALEAAKEGAKIRWASESPRASVERDEEDEEGAEDNAEEGEEGILDDKARERLLGSKRGKVVGDILVKDMQKKEKDKMGKVAGVSFWEIDVEPQAECGKWVVELVTGDNNVSPILGLLKEAVERGGKLDFSSCICYKCITPLQMSSKPKCY